MDKNSLQFYRVLKKYYKLRMSQKEIAESEQLSTATISRMIARAVEEGYVQFTLNLPALGMGELEDEIREKFGLRHVSVTRVDIEEPEIIRADVSSAVADYINQVIRPGDTIGVSWGNTLSEVAGQLKPKVVPDITVVGLNGGVPRNTADTGAEAVVRRFAQNYGGEGYMLPVPSFVDNAQIAEALKGDSRIRILFERIHAARLLIFSVGSIRNDSVLVQSGYFTEQDYEKLRREGYVGDICSRYFKSDGSHSEDDLYYRVIGISLEELKEKEERICAVMEERKAEGLLGALRGGYITSLFLDEHTAKKILEMV